MPVSNTTPVFAVDEKNLVPVSDHLKQMMDIPPSRMFLINKSLKVYLEKNPGGKIFAPGFFSWYTFNDLLIRNIRDGGISIICLR